RMLCVTRLLELTHLADPIYFFFSSRRRHTRCYRDWSSDVCSSDLAVGPADSGDAASSLRALSCASVLAANHLEGESKASNELTTDRKSTRLNSSHGSISYAVFCLKKKKHNLQSY